MACRSARARRRSTSLARCVSALWGGRCPALSCALRTLTPRATVRSSTAVVTSWLATWVRPTRLRRRSPRAAGCTPATWGVWTPMGLFGSRVASKSCSSLRAARTCRRLTSSSR
eukprot:Amastigsp_a841269_24.p4 type:complete len:114 gc:universal Amastigsp_a841269_24:1150-1491(+)